MKMEFLCDIISRIMKGEFMKYINNDKFLDTTKEVSEDKNFEHLYFAFLNEEKKKLKDDNKWNSKPFVIFDYKFCELLLKLNRLSNIKSNEQFKLWDFETFFNFHKEYNIDEMSELINLTELDSSYDIDYLISMGTSRCRRLFKEYYHFEVSDTLLTYENLLNKNLFYDVKQIDGFVNNHEDTNFVVFRNGIMFEESQVIYLFTKEYTVVKDYKNDCTSVFQDGSPVCFENIESLFEKKTF